MPEIAQKEKAVHFARRRNFDNAVIEKTREREVYCLCDLPNNSAPKIPCDGCHDWHNLCCFAIKSAKKVSAVKKQFCLPCRKVNLWKKLQGNVKKNTIPTLKQLKKVVSKLGIDTIGKEADLVVRLAVFLIESPANRIKILADGHLEPCRRRCRIGEISQLDTIKTLDYKLLRVACKECTGVAKGPKVELVKIFHQFLTNGLSRPAVISAFHQKMRSIPEGDDENESTSKRFPKIDMLCPEKHGLEFFKTKTSSYTCDICKMKLLMRSEMYGCKICNWNTCTPCGSMKKGRKTSLLQRAPLKSLSRGQSNRIQVKQSGKQEGLKKVLKGKVSHEVMKKHELALEAIEKQLKIFTVTQLKQECREANIVLSNSRVKKEQLIRLLAQHILKEDGTKGVKQSMGDKYSTSNTSRKQRKQNQGKHPEECGCDRCDLELAHLISNLDVSSIA